ncbi:MAG: DNA mismatch endonuclease Vsr [Planctomycetota bacterium]
MDTLTPKQRSERMSRIRAKDTKPEMLVRHLVHRMGYRFRLHSRKLPGCPDLVFQSRGKVVFVHGCFWHRHPRCGNDRPPKSRRDFWLPKLRANRERDKMCQHALRRLGWGVLVVWECETRNRVKLAKRIRKFMEGEEREGR